MAFCLFRHPGCRAFFSRLNLRQCEHPTQAVAGCTGKPGSRYGLQGNTAQLPLAQSADSRSGGFSPLGVRLIDAVSVPESPGRPRCAGCECRRWIGCGFDYPAGFRSWRFFHGHGFMGSGSGGHYRRCGGVVVGHAGRCESP